MLDHLGYGQKLLYSDEVGPFIGGIVVCYSKLLLFQSLLRFCAQYEMVVEYGIAEAGVTSNFS